MARAAFSTKFKWNGEYVAELSKINGVEITAKTIDVTTHDSPDGYTQEIPGLKTASDISLEGFVDETDAVGQQAMLVDFETAPSPLRTSLIIFPPAMGAQWSVPGHVTALKFGDAAIDGAVPFTATIKPYGKPTMTVATATGLTTTFFAISESAVIVPAPSGSVYAYVATVLNGVVSVTITPVASGTQTITVNGNTVGTGVPSSAITLGAAGSITDITVIVSDTNKAPKTYIIHVARAT